jgi:hypothetical protein
MIEEYKPSSLRGNFGNIIVFLVFNKLNTNLMNEFIFTPVTCISNFFSCKKEVIERRSMLVGKWNWQSSLQDNGTKMLPRDNSVVLINVYENYSWTHTFI